MTEEEMRARFVGCFTVICLLLIVACCILLLASTA